MQKRSRRSLPCQQVWRKITELFQGNNPHGMIGRDLYFSPSTVQNKIKWLKRSGETPVNKYKGHIQSWTLVSSHSSDSIKSYHSLTKPGNTLGNLCYAVKTPDLFWKRNSVVCSKPNKKRTIQTAVSNRSDSQAPWWLGLVAMQLQKSPAKILQVKSGPQHFQIYLCSLNKDNMKSNKSTMISLQSWPKSFVSVETALLDLF